MIIQLQKLFLIFARITSFIVLSPGFSYKAFPNIAKIGLSLSLTTIVYFMTPEIQVTGGFLLFMLLLLKEVFFGLAVGFIVKLLISAMEVAGQFIDFQAGFSMATVYDPSAGSNVAYYGKIYYWLSIAVFFMLNIHHKLLEALMVSFSYLPINTVSIGNFGIEGLIKLFALVFELGFNLAAPMIMVVLLTDIVMGIISRTVPQINVLMLGMPMKVLVSILIILLMFSGLMTNMGKILNMMPAYMENYFQQFM